MNTSAKMISVFGGSQWRPGDKEYDEAREIERRLAEKHKGKNPVSVTVN